MKLENKVAIITGSGSGMGKAEALRFAKEGARVTVADMDGASAKAVADEINAAGGKAIAVTANVTKTDDILAVIKAAEDAFGPIDILVNNAGVFDKYASVLDTPLERWNFLLGVNLTSMFEFSKAVLPGMIERKHGTIVNIASVAGLVAAKGGAAYTVSKHGVIGLTKNLCSDYARYGIRVNAICPGTIETPLIADVADSIPKDPIPARRFGQVDEVADLAVFLASDDARFLNGAAVPIDGGFTIQ